MNKITDKKKTGAAKVAPKGDTTQKRRQSRKREKLNEIAKAAGFASWSAYEIAVINDNAKITNKIVVHAAGIRVTHSDALEELKSLVQEHHKRVGKISCDDTCFCWDVESFISRDQMMAEIEKEGELASKNDKCGDCYEICHKL